MKSLFSKISVLFSLSAIFAPVFAFAQFGKDKLESVATKAYGSAPQTNIESIVGTIINGFLGLLGIAFVVLMVYAGYLWMTAQGEAEQVSKAKKMIVQAIIGLAIVLAAYAISTFVISRIQDATL